jgi:Ca2+-binding RTX toxin-like protein
MTLPRQNLLARDNGVARDEGHQVMGARSFGSAPHNFNVSGSSEDWFIVDSGGDNTFITGSGNDTISCTGVTGDDYIDSGGGNDIVYAGGGVDKVYGGSGNDELHGGDDEDELDGGDNDDFVYGDNGNDTLYGGKGYDHLYGGANNDTIYDGDGDDWVDGGSGNDTIRAGMGNNNLNGGSGTDTLDVNLDGGLTWYSEIAVVNLEANNALVFDQVTQQIYGNNSLTGIENIVGTDTAGFPNNSGIEDTLIGNASNNNIQGLRGDDYLDGRAGNDTLDGGAGNDIIIGGAGWDHLFGGAGNDTFVFDDGDSPFAGQLQLPNGQVITSIQFRDTIHDWNEGDVIDLRPIDANTTMVGDQGFHWVDALGGGAGELHLFGVESGFIIEGDVDGGGADFAINVLSTFVLDNILV